MHAPSPMALLLIAIVVLVLFGRGKVSSLMGEVGKGITAFKRGVKDGADEIERAADTPAADRATIAAVRTTEDLDAAAARARAEADRVQAEADRARARAAEGLRDVTPRDDARL